MLFLEQNCRKNLLFRKNKASLAALFAEIEHSHKICAIKDGCMPFVLNDENKVNSYGFRIRTSGIDLSRFQNNPVMLDDHWESTRYVVGKWNDIKKEGTNLTAIPEFDMEDEDAARLAGKVKRGFIKACSMGILFDPQDMQYETDGTRVLNKCELLEASIVAIPSNANAIRLYHRTDNGNELMNAEQIKLALNITQTKTEINTMKRVFLSTAALIALTLTDKYDATSGIEQSLVDDAILRLKNELDTTKANLNAKESALKAIADQAAAAKKLAVVKKVDDAIKEGRFDAVSTGADGTQVDNRTEFINMGMVNEATLDAVLSALPAKRSLAANVHNRVPATGEIKTMDDFQKLSVSEQLAYKAANPNEYEKLLATM